MMNKTKKDFSRHFSTLSPKKTLPPPFKFLSEKELRMGARGGSPVLETVKWLIQLDLPKMDLPENSK